MTTLRKVTLGVVSVPVLIVIAGQVADRLLDVPLPAYQPVEVAWLDQGWTPDDWQWFYHAPQGGSMELPIPYSWMINFEQPTIPLWPFGQVDRLMDPVYMSRLGFLSNPVRSYAVDGLSPGWAAPAGLSKLESDTLNNPDGLPVGFVKTLEYPDRLYNDGQGRVIPEVIGFNCSACHTGQLNFQGTGIRIDGGPAMTDLGKLRSATGYSMALTYYLPLRFRRFARSVLGEDHSREQRAELRRQMKDLMDRGRALQEVFEARSIYPTDEGFARLDAVGRIGNYVLGEEISLGNLAVADAPVNFPPIWDSPWFEWVQYNASFKQPMMRNAGEAMGVFSAVNFDDVDDPDSLFTSSVDVANLYEMEMLIRGPERYGGLRAPEWPESILGEIDRASAARGDSLYVENCQGCHLPPTTNPEGLLDDSLWIEDKGLRYLRLNLVNLFAIGTDPEAAVNMVERSTELGALGEIFADTADAHGWKGMDPAGMGGVVPFGVGLPFVIERVMQKKYADLGFSAELSEEFSGRRSPPFIQAPLAYKARPLNGVWATPPFLHNGSLQNIYQLLGPEAERDSTFWLGTKEYDPERLGYVTRPVEGGFLFDTGLTGNSNKGHHFIGGVDSWRSHQRGVIGRALSHEERIDIIEFIKSMPAVPGGVN